MIKQRKHNYPLYETTIFPDFRIMTENVAKRYPDRVAISYKENPNDKETKKITYATARDEIRALGEKMIDMGLRDKKVMICGKSSWGWIYVYFALMSIGAVTVPVDKDLPEEELLSIARRAGCTGICYGTEAADKVGNMLRELPEVTVRVAIGDHPLKGDPTVPDLIAAGYDLQHEGHNEYDAYEIDPDRLASIVFTSGTTGRGKGVMLSQTNIVSDMTQGMYNFAITPKTMMVLPPHHTFGSTVNIVGHFSQGSEIYISSGVKYFVREMGEQHPTHLVLVPLFLETIYKKIWASAEKRGKADTMRRALALNLKLHRVGIDLSNLFFGEVKKMMGGKLEMVICGGAALSQNIIDTFEGLGIIVLNGYGITECAPLISCNRNEYRKSGSVGCPIIGEKVKIREPNEAGEGEICVKGPNVMLGYFDDEEATAEAFDEEGYFRTGDYGKLDDEGWIYITGRKKNMILFSNGKNVYPEEIETVLQGIYGVGEVIVYAGDCKSDPTKEVIVAEIYPDAEALAAHGITDAKAYFDEQVKAANDKMISYKRVGMVKLRDTEFEKNTSRKIQRFKIDRSI